MLKALLVLLLNAPLLLAHRVIHTTEASKISPWSNEGRAAAAAAAAASELQTLVEAERRTVATDASALASPAAL